jgi:hypothetical protein
MRYDSIREHIMKRTDQSILHPLTKHPEIDMSWPGDRTRAPAVGSKFST